MQYKAAGVRNNVVRMDTDVCAVRWAVDGEGGGGDGGTFDAKYLKYIEAVLLIRYLYFQRYIGTGLGPLHPALHRNGD